jgi:hypothetical protein
MLSDKMKFANNEPINELTLASLSLKDEAGGEMKPLA